MSAFDYILKTLDNIDTGNIAITGCRSTWSYDDLKELLGNLETKYNEEENYLELNNIYSSSDYKILTEQIEDEQFFKIVRR